eukprot:SAG22_NODE_932_length_6448_cov_7.053709_9_plen_95_part_01
MLTAADRVLKARFGEGYRLELKLQRVTDAVAAAFKAAKLSGSATVQAGGGGSIGRDQLAAVCAECGDARRVSRTALSFCCVSTVFLFKTPFRAVL